MFGKPANIEKRGKIDLAKPVTIKNINSPGLRDTSLNEKLKMLPFPPVKFVRSSNVYLDQPKANITEPNDRIYIKSKQENENLAAVQKHTNHQINLIRKADVCYIMENDFGTENYTDDLYELPHEPQVAKQSVEAEADTATATCTNVLACTETCDKSTVLMKYAIGFVKEQGIPVKEKCIELKLTTKNNKYTNSNKRTKWTLQSLAQKLKHIARTPVIRIKSIKETLLQLKTYTINIKRTAVKCN